MRICPDNVLGAYINAPQVSEADFPAPPANKCWFHRFSTRSGGGHAARTARRRHCNRCSSGSDRTTCLLRVPSNHRKGYMGGRNPADISFEVYLIKKWMGTPTSWSISGEVRAPRPQERLSKDFQYSQPLLAHAHGSPNHHIAHGWHDGVGALKSLTRTLTSNVRNIRSDLNELSIDAHKGSHLSED